MTGNTDGAELVAVSYEKQKLIDWYNSLLAPQIIAEDGPPSFPCHGDSHRWHKAFRVGSELEWFNRCYDNFELNRHGHGISEEWIGENDTIRSGIKIIY